MEILPITRTRTFRDGQRELEQALNVRISLQGKTLQFEGPALAEYEASLVFEAIEFGFSIRQALQLKNDDIIFRRIHIRDHTRRKNLNEVRARVIGTRGKTRRVVEHVSQCMVIVHDSEVGLLGNVHEIEAAETALINLIKGTKQSNVYRYLERQNSRRKEVEFEGK